MVAKLNFFGNKKPSLVVLAMGLVSALAACATNSASRVAGYPNLRAPATDDALAWAEQTRARLEAELKTTPH
ncbi:MAG: hypothetical protein FD128_2182 [Hyphomonadaceae bacterium]|nr:MAG: hypothetical protein FD128_2182 [Hyphomonadaceae bacterium]